MPFDPVVLPDDRPEIRIRHQAADRQRHFGHGISVAADDTALHGDQPVCGLHDQFVAAARDDQVVAVVRDGRSEGSVLQVESGDVADGRRRACGA